MNLRGSFPVKPVAIELRITTAEARSKPKLRLPVKDEIHLIPAVSNSSPRYAGKAMMRLLLLFGNVRKVECGKKLSPEP